MKATPPKNPKIVVADDEKGVRRLVAEILLGSLPEAEILEAKDGREALEVIKAEIPDLVILDIMMPFVDGYAVLDDLRALRSSEWIPVVILTGFGDRHLEADLYRIGADAYLEKPVGQLKLQGTVWALLRLKAQCDALRQTSRKSQEAVSAVIRVLDEDPGKITDEILQKACLTRG